MKKKTLMLIIAGLAIISSCFGQAQYTFAANEYAMKNIKASFELDPSSIFFSSILRFDFEHEAMTVTSTDVTFTLFDQGLTDFCSEKIKHQTNLLKSHTQTILAAMYSMITYKPDQLSSTDAGNYFFIVSGDETGSTTFCCILSKTKKGWMLRCVDFKSVYSINTGAKVFFIS